MKLKAINNSMNIKDGKIMMIMKLRNRVIALVQYFENKTKIYTESV